MTVGYLKKQLEKYDDEDKVVFDDSPIDELNVHNSEFVDIYSVKQKSGIVLLQTRDCFDYEEELKEKIKYMQGKSYTKSRDILSELYLQGFTEEEISKAMFDIAEEEKEKEKKNNGEQSI